MKKLMFILLVTLLVGIPTYAQSTVDIEVDISNFKSNQGKVYVALYQDKGSWLNEMFKGAIGEIQEQKSKVVLEDVPAGVYAISLFHDSNQNGKLDMNFMGIPKEPIACSNNAKGYFGPPKWEDAKFAVESNSLNLKIEFQ